MSQSIPQVGPCPYKCSGWPMCPCGGPITIRTGGVIGGRLDVTPTCSRCRQPVGSWDRYCSHCGAKL